MADLAEQTLDDVLAIKDNATDEELDAIENDRSVKRDALKGVVEQLDPKFGTLKAIKFGNATEIKNLDENRLRTLVSEMESEIKRLTDLLNRSGNFNASTKEITSNAPDAPVRGPIQVAVVIARIRQLKVRVLRATSALKQLEEIIKDENTVLETAEKTIEDVTASDIVTDVVDITVQAVEKLNVPTTDKEAKKTIIKEARGNILTKSSGVSIKSDATQKYIKKVVQDIRDELDKVELSIQQADEEDAKKYAILRKSAEILEPLHDRLKESESNEHKEQHKNVFLEIESDKKIQSETKRKSEALTRNLRKMAKDHRNASLAKKLTAAKKINEILARRAVRNETVRAKMSKLPMGIATSLVRRYLDPHIADEPKANLVRVIVGLPGARNEVWDGFAVKSMGVASVDENGTTARFYYFSIFLDRTATVPMSKITTSSSLKKDNNIRISFPNDEYEVILDTKKDGFTNLLEKDVPYRMSRQKDGSLVIVHHWPGQDISIARRILVAVPVDVPKRTGPNEETIDDDDDEDGDK